MVNQIPDIKQSCLRCGKKELITDTETGEIFCGGCGYVSSERVESMSTIYPHDNFSN